MQRATGRLLLEELLIKHFQYDTERRAVSLQSLTRRISGLIYRTLWTIYDFIMLIVCLFHFYYFSCVFCCRVLDYNLASVEFLAHVALSV